MTFGFRICERLRKVDEGIIAGFHGVPISCVSDSMSRLFAAGPSVRPMHRGGAMAGAAFTVRTRPGDNLMIHKALDLLTVGDVLVVDGGGDLSNALMGEMMISHAIAIGVAGVVINGAIRDFGWIKSQAFPVFAVGVSHRGPFKDGPGEINVPIAIDGMIVAPGDLVLGDDDGVLSVPLDEAIAIGELAAAKMASEAATLSRTNAGQLPSKAWVDEILRARGCLGI